jgi:hypothetical protein
MNGSARELSYLFIDFLDIIHRPVVFLFKNNISVTGLCLRPQVEPYTVWANR